MKYQDDMQFSAEQTTFINEKRIHTTMSSHHGVLRKAIPCMTMPNAIFCCITNFLIPGLGTFLSAFAIPTGSNYESDQSIFWAFMTNILTAFLQLLTAPLLFGIIWSMIWGITFIQLSRKWWISNIHDRDSVIDYCPCSRC
uniref:Uncharacterized protein n=1 Tax=Strongyloides papillosus TaxID=174720 RepID=A0A0N5B7L6_STREA